MDGYEAVDSGAPFNEYNDDFASTSSFYEPIEICTMVGRLPGSITNPSQFCGSCSKSHMSAWKMREKLISEGRAWVATLAHSEMIGCRCYLKMISYLKG